jgi:2-dehydro-3-deoxy-D-arabinonate dehydratase
LENLNRSPKELTDFLRLENTFPHGTFLLTGTGIVPDDDFTLTRGDIIGIDIEGIGSLETHAAWWLSKNTVTPVKSKRNGSIHEQ